MKQNIARLLTISFLICAPSVMAFAQEKTPEGGSNRAPQSEAIKSLEVEGASLLSQLSGKWSYAATFASKNGATAKVATGTVTNEMIMDGRFLSSNEVGGLYIEEVELPFNNQQFIGYDSTKKHFSSVSINTFSAGVMIGQGTFNEKENTLKTTGSFTNPVTSVEEQFREVIEFIDPEHYKRTLFTTNKAGKETKLMEFMYSRGM